MTQEQINLVCEKANKITQEFKEAGLIPQNKVGEHELKMQKVIENLLFTL